VKARTGQKIETIGEFLEIIKPLFGREREKKELAKIFQALRIEVNRRMPVCGCSSVRHTSRKCRQGVPPHMYLPRHLSAW